MPESIRESFSRETVEEILDAFVHEDTDRYDSLTTEINMLASEVVTTDAESMANFGRFCFFAGLGWARDNLELPDPRIPLELSPRTAAQFIEFLSEIAGDRGGE